VTPKYLLRILVTLALAAAAVWLGQRLWTHYMDRPWTRDGRVHADVIDIAPDVSGQVVTMNVRDNQSVRRGDLLFRIDPERYRDALSEAQAAVAIERVTVAQRQRELQRRQRLSGAVVASEDLEIARAKLQAAQAQLAQARARRATAQLNLQRTEVRAPVDGYVTHLQVFTGDYAAAGRPLLALIDRHSYRVDGYFEETKLRHIRVGDPVSIRLLDGGVRLKGHVESIARGITDPDDRSGGGLLASVNPTFSWVRLAQRIPVRIALDPVPREVTLAAGMTCTVVIHPRRAAEPAPSSPRTTP